MNKRNRGRSRRPNNNQNNNPNKSLDSNGPDVRVRGSAKTIYDKYITLARDATSSGQRVKAESYLQHAEHYLRVVNELQAKAAAHAEQLQARQQQHQQQQNARRQKAEADKAEKSDANAQASDANETSEGAAKNKEGDKTIRRSKPRRTAKSQPDDSPTNGSANGDTEDAPKPRTRRKKVKVEPSADTEIAAASTD